MNFNREEKNSWCLFSFPYTEYGSKLKKNKKNLHFVDGNEGEKVKRIAFYDVVYIHKGKYKKSSVRKKQKGKMAKGENERHRM